jgi:hypothetical protein
MTTKRAMWFWGVGLLVAIAAIGTQAASRPLSAHALSVISAVDPEARVSPFDLQCNVKIPNGLAQCGSAASSCKNCHEVKGEDPVNTKGDWHTAHAFGDFCEYCHAGNVQATNKDAAHQGLVQPLGDVMTNCSSCHVEDYQARAETYAKTLGVTIGASTGGTTPASGAAASASNTAAQPAQSIAQQPAAVATPTYSGVTDYVAQYRAAKPLPPSTGTLVTGLLLALTVVGGGTFVYKNEQRLRLMPRPTVTEMADEKSQEMAQLLPIMKKLDVETLRALRTLLTKRS